ncbi:hypothetical protein K2X30_03190 [bacterium]|jgi:hypothetical protein|nr:hypothetical protein [bacterium]
MKPLKLMALGLLVSSVAAAEVAAPMAGFRGFVETDQTVNQRLLRSPKTSLGTYVGEGTKDFDTALLELMGVYKSTGLTTGYQNAQPNGVNLLLWYLVFSGFSEDFGKLCEDSSLLNDETLTLAKPLCAWPAASARTEENLEALWLQVMRYDAPIEEYQAWRDFFLGPEFEKVSHQELLQSASFAIFMNPYFLLRK